MHAATQGAHREPPSPAGSNLMKTNPLTNTLGLVSLLMLTASAFGADEKKTDPNADNSRKNERDRSGETVTPPDQSSAPEDVQLTRNIRQAVMKDKSLTMTAKNVKIISSGGKVTLRGPVNSAEEKTAIGNYATKAAGEGKVDNQLEVKADSKAK